jgi:neutral ceramidase
MTVDRSTLDGWKTVMDDGNWETKVHWVRDKTIRSQSLIVVEWSIPTWMTPGRYRITHRGYAKPSELSSKLTSYFGQTASFAVVA